MKTQNPYGKLFWVLYSQILMVLKRFVPLLSKQSTITIIWSFFQLPVVHGFRGLMSLAHRRPALTNLIFGQLWPQLWNRILLQQQSQQPQQQQQQQHQQSSIVPFPSSAPSVMDESESDTASFAHHDPFGSAPPSDSTTPGDTPVLNGHGLSVNEIKGFVIPQLIRFLSSDEHVHPGEPQPSSLGGFLAGLLYTSDTLLMHIPLPVVTVS